jgi:outer membrane biosynthesis protein TonB
MKIQFLALFAALQLTAAAHNLEGRRDRFHHRRQVESTTPAPAPPAPLAPSAPPPPASPSPPAPPVNTPSPPPPPPPPPPSNPENSPQPANPGTPTTTGNAPPAATQSASSTTTVNTGPPPAATGTEIPPIESVTSGMPTKPALFPTASYSAGAQPPVSGVPPLPTACESAFLLVYCKNLMRIPPSPICP